MNAGIEARKPSDGPFLYQHKRTLDVIKEAFTELQGISVPPAIAVYVALSYISSNDRSQAKASFCTTINEIMYYSGVSRRHILRILKIFEKLRIVHILRKRDESHYKKPSHYTLLPISELTWRKIDQEQTSEEEGFDCDRRVM